MWCNLSTVGHEELLLSNKPVANFENKDMQNSDPVFTSPASTVMTWGIKCGPTEHPTHSPNKNI